MRAQVPRRGALGFFQTFRKYLRAKVRDAKTGQARIHLYGDLVRPITIKRMSDVKYGKTFSDRWGAEQSAAFQRIRQLLLAGVHLHTPLPNKAFHMTTDMSQHGYGIYLYQLDDAGHKRCICHFNGQWTDAERSMPPPYKEGKAWAIGFERCLPVVRGSNAPFHTWTDSLPVGWMRKGNGRKAMSLFRLARSSMMSNGLSTT